MNNRVETDRDRNPQQRRAYQPPRLMTYGAVRELTTGGSAEGPEGTGQGNQDKTSRP